MHREYGRQATGSTIRKLQFGMTMANQIQITLRHVDRSDALETRIRRSVQKLERLCGRILSSRIVIEAPHHHRRQGRQFVVRVGVKVPGEEIIVDRDHHEDAYVALRDAFEAAGRQLEDYVRRRRNEGKNRPGDRRHAAVEGAQ
jgi:ribosomal subunit interface protein